MPNEKKALIVLPDSEGEVRPSCDAHAVRVWKRTASRLHFNRDFQINSQSLTACLTPDKAIGGTAWPNFIPEARGVDSTSCFVGQHNAGDFLPSGGSAPDNSRGRARLAITELPSLTVLDPRELNQEQLAQAETIFERFKKAEFLPANEAYQDDARKALDRAILVDLLGLPKAVLEPLDILRKQWCAEPSVHGGKKTRASP